MGTKEDYERFLAGLHRPAHGRRTAERWAAFLLPHLRPEMRLLDLGCGSGSITVGLGVDAIGIDQAPVAIESVPVAAADPAALPFRDESFDALFANALLQHVDDPLAVLCEARRVARPGAVMGLADADWDGVLFHPHEEMIDRGWTVRESMRSAGGVRVGRELRALLEAAGFERCEASATGHAEGTADAVARLGWFEASWFAAPQVVAYVAELGIADPDEMAAIAGAWTRWATHPGALAARFWITAIGWAPAW